MNDILKRPCRLKVCGVSEGSDVSNDTVLELRISDGALVGEYWGGSIVKGFILGRLADNQRGIFDYIQIGRNGLADSGRSDFTLLSNEAGKLRLIERYTWTSKVGSGVNIFDEIVDDGRDGEPADAI